jgi:hypothetical protein
MRSAARSPTTYGAFPRATRDVDVNVFVDDGKLEDAIDAPHAAGVTFDDDEARKGQADGGFFVGHLGPVRIDVFTPSIPFSWEAARTRVRVAQDGSALWFLSAESTVVFKLLFYRGKDLVDVERLVAAKRTEVDHAYIRRWLVEMLGDDDKRVETYDDIVRRFSGS